MQWRIENLRMIILRQVFINVSSAPGSIAASNEEEEAWCKCLESALTVIKSVDTFTALPRSAMEWWYALCVALSSS
jgi:hypothetical protein